MQNKFWYYVKHISFTQIVKYIWFYIWGHILGVLFYEKKYYYGKWFKGRYGGIAAPGWRWICIDAMGKKFNPDVPWPCSPQIRVGNYGDIHFHPDDVNNFQGVGNYFQTFNGGQIYIGKGTWIAMNVGIITTNHSIENPDNHDSPRDVIIGEKCWIGMNAVILPGVTLGVGTIVGAGSVVTKSFPEGYCVIAGNPAKKIKDIPLKAHCDITEEKIYNQ